MLMEINAMPNMKKYMMGNHTPGEQADKFCYDFRPPDGVPFRRFVLIFYLFSIFRAKKDFFFKFLAPKNGNLCLYFKKYHVGCD